MNIFDERYAAKEFAYGIEPNDFFKESIEKWNCSGDLLLPGEGEGRNAVFAAKQGLNVFAFDISAEGKKKAEQLAEDEQVRIDYRIGDFFEMDYQPNSMDVVALIYAHFPPPIRASYHSHIAKLTKSGGLSILEGFSENNLPFLEKNPAVGGPAKLEMLFTKDKIKNEFPDFEVLELDEKVIHLSEGLYHQGEASIIRFVGRKK